MARLVLLNPDPADGEQAFPLPPHSVLVGRSQDCAIRIDRESISRHHARIHYSREGLCVEELESMNGCFVNDLPVARAILHDGDVLKLGTAMLKVDLFGGLDQSPSSDDDGGSAAPAPAVLHPKRHV